jgi:DNA modification methylase
MDTLTLTHPPAIPKKSQSGVETNRLTDADRPFHEWYRFVLSFPPHLVREYLEKFGIGEGHTVLDPFCGTGTTVVECKKRNINSVGIEANAMAWFAGDVKVDWSPDPTGLIDNSRLVAEKASQQMELDGIEDTPAFGSKPAVDSVKLKTLSPEVEKLILTNSISPLPLHKVLVLLECLDKHGDPKFRRHQKLALARELVSTIGNLHFGPEVGVGKQKPDVPVVSLWLTRVRNMSDDLTCVRGLPSADAIVHHADSRKMVELIEPQSIDAVITSPPYPNEKDYTRTTRLESVLLGFINSKEELRELKRGLIRSNTRGVYKSDDDDEWVSHFPEIQRIADEIEARRIELGKTSGFEKLYGRVTKLYFGGMARHLSEMRRILKPGAQLGYVVGDQASYLRVMIRTGEILADVASDLGYEVVGIDLFRTRIATATKEQLREEVVVLKWNG